MKLKEKNLKKNKNDKGDHSNVSDLDNQDIYFSEINLAQ